MKLQEYFFSILYKDYFNDVLTSFLGLECVNCVNSVAVYWSVRKILDFIKNILISLPKMNKGFTGLERHEGE